jgi:hypothetical protein
MHCGFWGQLTALVDLHPQRLHGLVRVCLLLGMPLRMFVQLCLSLAGRFILNLKTAGQANKHPTSSGGMRCYLSPLRMPKHESLRLYHASREASLTPFHPPRLATCKDDARGEIDNFGLSLSRITCSMALSITVTARWCSGGTDFKSWRVARASVRRSEEHL